MTAFNMTGRAVQTLNRLVAVAAICALIGCAAPSAAPEPGADDFGGQQAREIEEADIIKLVDGIFYVANPYSGLRLIDGTNVDAPTFAGSAALGGRAIELFVRDGLAFILTAADFFYCAGDPVGFASEDFSDIRNPDYEGSRLWVVDVTDPDAPSVVTQFDFDGFASATRRVGDVLYVTGQYTDIGGDGDGDGAVSDDLFDFQSGVFVSSINVADPDNVAMVEELRFDGRSLDVHVETDAMYVVGPDPQLRETTLVSYVDISDPAGDLALRDQFRVPGTISNRFFVDAHEQAFRIVTSEFLEPTFDQVVALYTYDVSNPDDVERLARLVIISNESLRAVRFDGARGYVVTFVQIDPLFVLDLSDPASPQVTGELEVPGYSTHLVPLGDRLVGVGFDDTAGFRPAVALYDVGDPTDPRQLSRVVLGDRWEFSTFSEATVDEKALRVLEDEGLVLLPFGTFDEARGAYVDYLQFIELTEDRLNERGTIEHRGLVRRADLLDGRTWVLSDLAFQTVNIDDLNAPVSVAALDILDDQELLDAGLTNCATTSRTQGTELGGFFFDGPFFGGPCGILGPFFFLFALLGLAGLKRRGRP